MSEKTEEFLEKLAPCIEKGDLEACVDEASRLAEEISVSGEELLDLSRKFGGEGRHDLAYVLALTAASILKEYLQSRAYNNAGLAAQHLGYHEISEDQYKKSIELNPEFTPARFNYANLLVELGRWDEAEKQYQLAIENDPKFAPAYNNYGNLLAELGRRREAEKQYQLAIKKDPKYSIARNNYAKLLKDLGRRNDAEGYYKKAIESDPKLALAHNNYADLLRIQNRFSEAEMEVNTALQIEPSNPYALSTLGDILADEEYFEEAEKQYKEALKHSGSMNKSALSEVHNNLGYVYYQLKKNRTAEKEFQKAKELSGNVIRNLRAIKKTAKMEGNLRRGLLRGQKCFLVSIILILLGFCYYLFLYWEIEGETRLLSDTMFVAQSCILMGLLIFVLFADQLARLKVGPQGVELEMSTEHRTMLSQSLSTEATPRLER